MGRKVDPPSCSSWGHRASKEWIFCKFTISETSFCFASFCVCTKLMLVAEPFATKMPSKWGLKYSPAIVAHAHIQSTKACVRGDRFRVVAALVSLEVVAVDHRTKKGIRPKWSRPIWFHAVADQICVVATKSTPSPPQFRCPSGLISPVVTTRTNLATAVLFHLPFVCLLACFEPSSAS